MARNSLDLERDQFMALLTQQIAGDKRFIKPAVADCHEISPEKNEFHDENGMESPQSLQRCNVDHMDIVREIMARRLVGPKIEIAKPSREYVFVESLLWLSLITSSADLVFMLFSIYN